MLKSVGHKIVLEEGVGQILTKDGEGGGGVSQDPSVHFVFRTHQELRPWDTWYMKTEYLEKQKELGILVVGYL